jgi:WD40 repeat protein
MNNFPALEGGYGFSPRGNFTTVVDRKQIWQFHLPNGRIAVAAKPKDSDPIVVPKPKDPPGKSVLLRERWSADAPANGGWCYAEFTGDGQTFVVSSSAVGGIKSFSAANGELLPAAVSVGLGKNRLFPAGDGRMAVHAGLRGGNKVVVWDTKTGKETSSFPISLEANGGPPIIRLSPDERILAVASQSRGNVPGEVRLIETATGKEFFSTKWEHESLHFSGDSSRLLIAESTGAIRTYHFKGLGADKPLAVSEMSGLIGMRGALPPRVHGLSGDGKLILFEGVLRGSQPNQTGLYLLNGKTGALVRRLADASFTSSSVLSRDGRYVARLIKTDKDGHFIDVINANNWKVLIHQKIMVEPRPFMGFALSADNRALGVYDLKTVRVFDLPSTLMAAPVKSKSPEPIVVPKPKDPKTVPSLPRSER